MLFELACEAGLDPKKISSTRGGEFHSSCPACGGENRFMFWPNTGRYWCRRCKILGDAIQFCHDFLNMSFQEALMKVGFSSFDTIFSQRRCSPVVHPPSSWKEKAIAFIENSHRRLLIDPAALNLVKARGLTLETVKQHRIGWNPVPIFPVREEWGLERKIENGKEKKLFIPSGIVIPTFQNGKLQKIKIRKNEWREGDYYGKYYIVPGSVDCMPVFGDLAAPITVLVESEFDGMLIIQEVGNSCSCLALGGAQKEPDEMLHQWLDDRDLILFALDFDEGGQVEYDWWQTTFSQLEPWPVPEEKSPGDYFVRGGNLQTWTSSGIEVGVGKSASYLPFLA